MSLFSRIEERLFGRSGGNFRTETADAHPDIHAATHVQPPSRLAWQTGDKWAGGFGATDLLIADYWTLRARSIQLFETNIYARGIIRRLITNEINTGLHLEATPEESILGLPEDALGDWSEEVETRFELWGSDPQLCDHQEQCTFGQLQAALRRESLVAGDVLVLLSQDQRTRLPRIQLISGSIVQTPFNAKPRGGNKIKHGVEVDAHGRHVAYWIRQDGNRDAKRLPAWGEKSGRRLAWLVYGTDKRLDEVRGRPLLSLILQSLKEIDRYRDSVQAKATVNAIVAGFIKRSEANMPSRPFTTGGGAIRVGTNAAVDNTGTQRSFGVAEAIPGVFLEQLQPGEEPVAFNSQGTDEKFGDFEAAIIQGIAWSMEIPPEILRQSYNSNYSASQAANNDFKMYLDRVRTDIGAAFCQPIYVEWLLAQALSGRVDAPGLVESWQDWSRFEEFAAWCSSDWSGQIKPSVDPVKLAKAEIMKLEAGLTTRGRAMRELTGMKFSRSIKQLARENEQLAEANQSLQPKSAEPAPPAGPDDDDEESQQAPPSDEEARALRIVEGTKE